MLQYLIYIAIILTGLTLNGVIILLLMRKKLNESNALMWLLIGFVIILAGIYPKLIVKLSSMFFITYPPAFIFTIAIIILLFIVLRNTIVISELTAKVQETASETSILKYELHEIKKQLQKMQNQNLGIDEE